MQETEKLAKHSVGLFNEDSNVFVKKMLLDIQDKYPHLHSEIKGSKRFQMLNTKVRNKTIVNKRSLSN